MKYKVWVRCATFNHALYITSTMDGFCHQQTKFPFLCIILDDASKDGEQEIIKQYLCDNFTVECVEDTDDYHLTVARHKENKNCYFAVYLLRYNHYSVKKSKEAYYQEWIDGANYVALCEGDDYWTDEYKLQKQADALDANPQAFLVYTSFQVIDGDGKPISRPHIKEFPRRSHSGDNLPTLLRHGNYVMTLTTMYRNETMQSEALRNCPYKMDFALTLAAALMGDFIWLPEQMANYRSLQSGMIMSDHPRVVRMTNIIYRYYADLLMNGDNANSQCKPLSKCQRMRITMLLLLWALRIKDDELRKNILRFGLMPLLMLPVAYIRLKYERLKDRIERMCR